jgi:amino acid transporter
MRDKGQNEDVLAEDEQTLRRMGYGQELARRMSGFSNYAISLSIICILAGGITSFHIGLCSVGGASIGLGWPLGSLLALAFAAAMGQVASAFPTAGGLYHWASILGGTGWGWLTAWFNLTGLITVLAAINVGCYQFILGSIGPALGYDPAAVPESTQFFLQAGSVLAITLSQAMFNHRGIRVTTLLTDFSGYWILIVATALTVCLVIFSSGHDVTRLLTFQNFSGLPEDEPVWPHVQSIPWLFALGFILPAYTITGFDASAHTSEETVAASHNVPRGIVRSVVVSGLFGWIMLSAMVMAIPDMKEAAAQGGNAFYWMIGKVLPSGLSIVLMIGIGIAQYLCGLATVTSASRMAYAFARDGGLPFSIALRRVNPLFQTPAVAIWVVALLAVGFTIYNPVYSTITTVAVIFLYLSYGIPTFLGLCAYGRSWTKMGPWTVGKWYRPLAVVCVAGCVFLFLIGVQPPNQAALWISLAAFLFTAVYWFTIERHRFRGPPVQGLALLKSDEKTMPDTADEMSGQAGSLRGSTR